METKEKSILEKLMIIRLQLSAMNLRKHGENKFAGYKYFELSDFLPVALQLFNDQGLCPVVTFTRDMATLHINDTTTGSVVEFTSPMADATLKGAHPIQNLGAVETYQRRYLYMVALELTEPDALDSSQPLNGHSSPQPENETAAANKYDDDGKPWITEKQVKACIARIMAGEQDVTKQAKAAFKISRKNWDLLMEAENSRPQGDLPFDEPTNAPY